MPSTRPNAPPGLRRTAAMRARVWALGPVSLCACVLGLAVPVGAPAMAVASGPGGRSSIATATVRTVTGAPPGSIYYEEESRSTFESQLRAHQIREAEFNKVAEHLHLLLRDGHHVYIAYPGHEQPALQHLILAAGVPVSIEVAASKAGATHHTLRYIVAAILVVALFVLAALLIARRRRLGSAGAAATPGGDEAR
ncbi:MAG: hypothetical protein ACYDA6_09835 [Solirubrobacteraceae bacterium]